MDLLNVLLGIGYLRVVSVRQVADLWYRNAKSPRSGETLAHRLLDNLTEQKMLHRSRWIHATWGPQTFNGKFYTLSNEGARVVREEYGLTDYKDAIGASSIKRVSSHTLMASHVLGYMVRSLSRRYRRIGASFWREAAISSQIRTDALIGLLASSSELCPRAPSGAWEYAPFILWETFAYVSAARDHGASAADTQRQDVPALYALELDCGHDSVASFGRRAVDYYRGRMEQARLRASPAPLVITIGRERARRIVEAWRSADQTSPIYAIDINLFLQEPLEHAPWFWSGGNESREIGIRSPFAWIASYAARIPDAAAVEAPHRECAPQSVHVKGSVV